jgi:hypothetical protein
MRQSIFHPRRERSWLATAATSAVCTVRRRDAHQQAGARPGCRARAALDAIAGGAVPSRGSARAPAGKPRLVPPWRCCRGSRDVSLRDGCDWRRPSPPSCGWMSEQLVFTFWATAVLRSLMQTRALELDGRFHPRVGRRPNSILR